MNFGAWEVKASVEINLCPKTTNTCYALCLVWIYSCILWTHTQEIWIIDASVCYCPFFPQSLIHCALQSPLVTDSCVEPRSVLWLFSPFSWKVITFSSTKCSSSSSVDPKVSQIFWGIFCLCKIQCDIIMQLSKELEQWQAWIIHAFIQFVLVCKHLHLCRAMRVSHTHAWLYKCADEAGMPCTEGDD